MSRFEDLTLYELDVLRSVLAGNEKRVDEHMRAFLLGQVEGQFSAKLDNEKLRSEAQRSEGANGSSDMRGAPE